MGWWENGALWVRLQAGGSSHWLDQNGDQVAPPLTNEGAAGNAIALAVLLWIAVTAAMTLLHLLVRLAHEQIRLRRWAGEWERIAPGWTS